MNIFFDMDHTILEVDSGYLRPGLVDVFHRLRADGHSLYIWSGNGARHAEVRLFRLHDLVEGVFAKPIRHFHQAVQERLDRKEIPVWPDLVVDDHPTIVDALGGVVVEPFGPKPWQQTSEMMERVYQIIRDYAAKGHSEDSAFRPGGVEEEE